MVVDFAKLAIYKYLKEKMFISYSYFLSNISLLILAANIIRNLVRHYRFSF